MDIQVDPTLVNQGYKNLLAETQSRLQEQVVNLQAAVTQLANEREALTERNQGLESENKMLRDQVNQETGRQDGVPQDE